MKKTGLQITTLAIVFFALALAAPAQTPLGTAFTYQGQLRESGLPANGEYDVQFSLWDAAAGGTPSGTTLCSDNVDVVDGLFTLELDFGASPFSGEARWLQIGVRPGGPPGDCAFGAYTLLAPRQELTTVPYALFALAGAAAAANDFSLDWWTIDGGGNMWTTGGDFELSGTIGQPDAGVVMTGGNFELVGGFWPGAHAGPSICRGDLNCSGFIDFGDINPFVLALSNWPEWKAAYPDCPEQNADVNGDGVYGGVYGFGDINPFVELLAGAGGQPIPCP